MSESKLEQQEDDEMIEGPRSLSRSLPRPMSATSHHSLSEERESHRVREEERVTVPIVDLLVLLRGRENEREKSQAR